MSFEIRVSVQGDEHVKTLAEGLDKLNENDLSALLTVIAERVAGQNRRRVLEDNSGPNGEAWPPLAKSTLKYKKGKKMLVETGTLAGSISYEVSGLTARVGPGEFYGAYHQFGTRKMPARVFLGVSPSDAADLEDIVNEFVATHMGFL